MEDLVIVESNDYAQVVFDDVLECYPENTDLECYFTLNELLKPDATDFIGIYKVGFAGLKDSLASQQINIEAIGETNKGKVVFVAEKVPKDDGEFYQFVYVSLGKHIRGASIPFQFKRTHINDYVQIDDQEQVIIKSKESEINETLNEMKARCINLTQANEDYERLIKENEDLIKLLKEEINLVKTRCGSLSIENEHLNHELSGKADNLRLLRETVSELADENKKIKNKYDNLINENRNLGDLLQKRINQVEILKTELESIKTAKSEIEMLLNLKEQELSELRKEKEEFIRLSEEIKQMNVNDKISKLELQVDDRVNELNKIKYDLKHNEELISEQQQTIQVILTERDSLNAIIQKLQKEKKDLEASHETLSQELLVKNDKLKQVEECKEVLRNQLVAMTNEIEIANERLKENSTELYKISDCEKRYSEENKRLLEEIETTRNEYESKLEQIRGSNYALNLAHQHLENRIRTLSNKHENEIAIEKVKSDKLREENENLKQRIYSGAYEYTILHKKYLKLKNYLFNKIQSNELIINKQQNDKTDDVNSNNKNNELIEDLLDEQTKSELSTFGCSSSSSATTTPSPSSYNITPHDDNSIRKTLYLPLNTTPSTHYNNYQTYNCHIPSSSPATIINNNNYLNDVNKAIQQLEILDHHKYLNKEQQQNLVHHILTPSTSATISINNKIESSVCEICGHVFPKDIDALEFSEHLTSHFGPSCPVCFLTFRKGYPQDEFETHVNGHFTN